MEPPSWRRRWKKNMRSWSYKVAGAVTVAGQQPAARKQSTSHVRVALHNVQQRSGTVIITSPCQVMYCASPAALLCTTPASPAAVHPGLCCTCCRLLCSRCSSVALQSCKSSCRALCRLWPASSSVLDMPGSCSRQASSILRCLSSVSSPSGGPEPPSSATAQLRPSSAPPCSAARAAAAAAAPFLDGGFPPWPLRLRVGSCGPSTGWTHMTWSCLLGSSLSSSSSILAWVWVWVKRNTWPSRCQAALWWASRAR